MSAVRRGRPWGFGRVLLLALAVVGILLSLGLVAAGIGLLWADQTQRGDDGYLSTGTERFASESYALATDSIDARGDGAEWLLSEDLLGKIRIEATGAEKPVFIGIAPTTQVNGFLAGVEHDELVDLTYDPFSTDLRRREGEAPRRPPTEDDLWVASVSGEGRQTLRWDVEPGEWSVVLMNADASRGVAADVRAAAEAGFLLPVAIGLMIVGGLFLGGSGAMLYAAVRDPALGAAPPIAAGAASTPLARDYPVGLRGDLDPGVSRWLWLVKWLLLIPHFVILFVLWIAFFVLTVGAFFAILFTARYPRGIFDFNVGVMRWTWRVLFYGYWALGTDRYPPFTLARVDDYPAALEIEYPARLSRGLVLVKWWLLALPHLVLVALFAGGWGWGVFGDDGGWFASWGLVGILVLIAAIVLLVTGRYPRGIFEFVLGLDRWVWRVGAYVSLMTDRYPPFRLDPGAREAGSREAEEAPPPSE